MGLAGNSYRFGGLNRNSAAFLPQIQFLLPDDGADKDARIGLKNGNGAK